MKFQLLKKYRGNEKGTIIEDLESREAHLLKHNIAKRYIAPVKKKQEISKKSKSEKQG
jgi:hypothetical protein